MDNTKTININQTTGIKLGYEVFKYKQNNNSKIQTMNKTIVRLRQLLNTKTQDKMKKQYKVDIMSKTYNNSFVSTPRG